MRYGEDAAVICGGTELLLLMKLGFAAYGHLVDIKGIERARRHPRRERHARDRRRR